MIITATVIHFIRCAYRKFPLTSNNGNSTLLRARARTRFVWCHFFPLFLGFNCVNCMKWDLWNTDTVITASRTSSTAFNICCNTLTHHCKEFDTKNEENDGHQLASFFFFHFRKPKKFTILSKQRHTNAMPNWQKCQFWFGWIGFQIRKNILVLRSTESANRMQFPYFLTFESYSVHFWHSLFCHINLSLRSYSAGSLGHRMTQHFVVFVVIVVVVAAHQWSTMRAGKHWDVFDLSSANDRAWIISIIRHLQRMRE